VASLESHAQEHGHVSQLLFENLDWVKWSGRVCGPIHSGSLVPEKSEDGVAVQ